MNLLFIEFYFSKCMCVCVVFFIGISYKNLLIKIFTTNYVNQMAEKMKKRARRKRDTIKDKA